MSICNLFFPANETHLQCPGEYFQQVIWRKTAGRHFDKQSCPTDSGKLSLFICYFSFLFNVTCSNL